MGRELDRLVGRRPALPRARVRAHAPSARAGGDAGRHHVPLRDRRGRGGDRTGARRGRRRRRPRRRRPGSHRPGPRRRAARRTAAAHRPDRARGRPSGCSRTSATRSSSPSRSWARRRRPMSGTAWRVGAVLVAAVLPLGCDGGDSSDPARDRAVHRDGARVSARAARRRCAPACAPASPAASRPRRRSSSRGSRSRTHRRGCSGPTTTRATEPGFSPSRPTAGCSPMSP